MSKRKTCRKPKRKPYGTKGTDPYCVPHDSCMTYTVSKRAERQKAIRDIIEAKIELDEEKRIEERAKAAKFARKLNL